MATIKPSFKRKARLVACGNQAITNEDAEVAAGGLCTVSTKISGVKGISMWLGSVQLSM